MCKDYTATGACITCYPGYAISGSICIVSKRQDPNCQTYTEGGFCFSCYSGFYLNQAQGICLTANPLCKTSNLSDGTCTSCFPGFAVNAGTCSVSFQDPNCLKFDAGKTTCLQCAVKFYLDSTNKCHQVSPLCKTFNLANGACLTCFPGYVSSGVTCIVSTASNSDTNC
jgi:hypothetical protein